MSDKSINKLIKGPTGVPGLVQDTVRRLRAALSLRNAVRPCLTGAHSPLQLSRGYASKRGQAAIVAGIASLSFTFQFAQSTAFAQKRRVPPGGHIAVVADERLAALRALPDPSARLLRRLGRGRLVSIRGAGRSHDGLLFYRVFVTRRTLGWLQSDSVVAPWRPGDDQRLFHLIAGPDEFERIARARVFLDSFPRSPLRPEVLLLYGDAADEAARKLSREAERRLEKSEIPADGAPEYSYFLNYSGLDRYNRQGVRFVFDRAAKQFHYDGAAWRELVRRYPTSPEAAEARKRLEVPASREKP